MPIKVSQLPELTTVDAGTIFSIVDTAGTLVSKKASALNVANYILAGNAATATKLATARNINGVPFDGTTNISITSAIPISTSSVLGGVKIGSNLSVDVDGIISVNTSTIATKTYVDSTSTDNAISFSVALG
jgi:hypothetical protein